MRPLAQTPCLRGEAQGLETERDRRPLPLCRTWEDKGAEPRHLGGSAGGGASDNMCLLTSPKKAKEVVHGTRSS